MDKEKVITELVEHIESALDVDSDYVDCVRTDLLQVTVALLKEQEETINKLRAALQMKTTMTFTQIGDNNKQIINTGAVTMNL